MNPAVTKQKHQATHEQKIFLKYLFTGLWFSIQIQKNICKLRMGSDAIDMTTILP